MFTLYIYTGRIIFKCIRAKNVWGLFCVTYSTDKATSILSYTNIKITVEIVSYLLNNMPVFYFTIKSDVTESSI